MNPIPDYITAKPRVVLVWVEFGAYHLARLRAVQNQFGKDCVGIELVGGYGDYKDCSDLSFRAKERSGLNIITLFPEDSLRDIPPITLITCLLQTLIALSPETVALCGYHRLENLVALVWAKLTGRRTILLCESKQDDAPRNWLWEELKSWIVRQFDSYLVGGTPHRQYLTALGADPGQVCEGYDVVDNQFFTKTAEEARAQGNRLRLELSLPEHYFLVVCRFVSKKNLPMLLTAYEQYRKQQPGGWGLVLCGGGPLEAELRHRVTQQNIPDVQFAGYVSGQLLGYYYGLASCFIHPSSLEQWGLVVNEAMAAGLPVLVSQACGCTIDLVEEGVNGFAFNPSDPEALARLMERMSADSHGLEAMGQASQRIIQKLTPATFAENLVLAMGGPNR
ncbi:MAG TPA: glycosyltransferase [Methylococcales bacterium]